MNVNPEEIVETRIPTAADVAGIVKAKRGMNQWTQATLAEIARVTERTVQRVENDEPSSLDTRRALARAFGYEVDFFERPLPFPNINKFRAREEELEKATLVVPIILIRDGRTLRTMTEQAECSAAEEVGDVSVNAREAFASVVDYLRDYNDISDVYSVSQRLDVDRDIDALLKKIDEARATVGAGVRHARIRAKSDAPDLQPVDWTIIIFVLSEKNALPPSLRIPMAFQFA